MTAPGRRNVLVTGATAGIGRTTALELARAGGVAEGTGGLDVLVDNAGVAVTGPLLDIPDAQLRAVFDTNLFGLLGLTGDVVPRGHGRLVNVSSTAGRFTTPLTGAYSASRSGLVR